MTALPRTPVDITIDTVGRRGDGVGDWEGKPVFVPRTLPGEKVAVQLLHDREQGIAGRLKTVMTPSPERITAPCPYYERCGGCALQHWAPENYRGWKIERVPGLLARAGVEVGTWLPPVFIPDRTRRRASFAAVVENGKLRLGFHRARTHDIADIPDCMLLTPHLQKVAQGLRPYLLEILVPNKPVDIFMQDTGMALDVLITGPVSGKNVPDLRAREAMGLMAQSGNLTRLSWRREERGVPEIIVQQGPVNKQAGNLIVPLPPGAFMQPSAEGEAALINAALAPVKASGAKRIADLFAGCGTFSGPLLALGLVLAAESDAPMMAALAKAASGTALKTDCRNLYSEPLNIAQLTGYDAVLFDPPRNGAREQAGQLARSAVPLVVGISCNPATFVRDAEILQGGGYKLESVQIIDQFIYSSHMELVGIFRR